MTKLNEITPCRTPDFLKRSHLFSPLLGAVNATHELPDLQAFWVDRFNTLVNRSHNHVSDYDSGETYQYGR